MQEPSHHLWSGHEEHRRLSVRAHDLSLARLTDRSGDSEMTGYARTNHLSSSSDADRAALRIVLRSQPRLEPNHIHTTKEDPQITVDRLMTRRMVNIEAGTSAIEAAKIMKNRKIGGVSVKQMERPIDSHRRDHEQFRRRHRRPPICDRGGRSDGTAEDTPFSRTEGRLGCEDPIGDLLHPDSTDEF